MVPQKRQASRQAGVSTASMGKYDKRLPDEKADERAMTSKRRKFAPVSEAGSAESQRTSALVDNIIARRGTGAPSACMLPIIPPGPYHLTKEPGYH